MHLQMMLFDGPRSEALVQASHHAGRERIAPLITAHPELRDRLLGGVRAVGPDGAECVLVFARDEAALDTLGRIVMTSELLPGEDRTLLTGPDRVHRYETSDVFGPLADVFAQPTR